MQSEAEILATELEEAAADGLDVETLNEVEESVEAAAEAFLTMKEARTKLQEVRKDRGYGKPSTSGGSPGASKVSLKKQSEKHPCFDCGLPGHWAGDPECQKPGQQLGRKKGKPPVKQVKVTETMNTEHIDPDGSHEVLTVLCSPQKLTADFETAFNQSHMPKEVNLVQGLTKDKRLVGALDSACNRTCTGCEWLSSYLTCLRESAPKAVLELVLVEDENETFRFGNGGCQKSSQRWRLPTMVGGVVLCFWTSVVDVPSLGLLLGRDFLEAVGAVMNFSKKLLHCELLGAEPIRLRQLSAGHFFLGLLPERWPGLGPQRWRKLGVDGVVEIQMSTSRWLHSRFDGTSRFVSQHPDGHDHFLTESSLHFGNLVCSVLADRGSAVQASMPRQPARKPSRTTSSSRTSTTTSLSADDDAKRPGDPSPSALAKDDPSHERKVNVGSKRSPAVVLAKVLFALSAFALPGNLDGRHLVRPRTEASQGQGDQQAPFDEGLRGRQVHLCPPERMHPVAEPHWFGRFILRRSSSSGLQVGQGRQGFEPESQVRSSGGSSNQSPGSSRSWRVGTTGEGAHWTSRWTTNSPKRSCEAGGIAERPNPSVRHCGADQGEGQADRCIVEGRLQTFRKSQGQGRRQEAYSGSIHRGVHPLQELEERGFGKSSTRECALASSSGDAKELPGSLGPHGIGDARTPKRPLGADDRTQSHRRHRDGVPGGAGWLSGGAGHGGALQDRPGLPCRSGHEPGAGLRGQTGRPVWRGEDSLPEPRGERGSAGSLNPFLIHQELKRGQADLIAQAWNQHVSDRVKVSRSARQVRHALEVEYFEEMNAHLNEEPFVQVIDLSKNIHEALANEHNSDPTRPFVAEVFTNSRNVMKEAMRRGHVVGSAMSLENGWNFLRRRDREEALRRLQKEKPYCVVLAFPCGSFSPLQYLNSKSRMTWPSRMSSGRILMNFALQVARQQLREGRHCILENPRPSLAWKEPEMRRFIEEDVYEAIFDQCRFGLKGPTGQLHKKATQVVSSSPSVTSLLHDVRCKRDHEHMAVIGGAKITSPAGVYPLPLARAMVRGLEAQFEKDYKPREVLAANAEEDPENGADAGGGQLQDDSDPEMEETVEEKKLFFLAQ